MMRRMTPESVKYSMRMVPDRRRDEDAVVSSSFRLDALAADGRGLTDRQAADEDVESGTKPDEDGREFHDLSSFWRNKEAKSQGLVASEQ